MKWPLLSTLSGDLRRQLLAASHRRRYGRREVLFHEGDPADTMHLIDKGHVAVRMTTPLGDVVTLAVLGPGDVVGELALLDKASRRIATVTAVEPVQTLAVHRDNFTELRRAEPAVDRFLIEVLAAEVRRLSELVVESLHVPVEKRVVRRLLALTEIYGAGEPGTEILLTQDDLASLAGTSRATVNRVLRESEEAGTVRLSRGSLTVLRPEELARRAR